MIVSILFFVQMIQGESKKGHDQVLWISWRSVSIDEKYCTFLIALFMQIQIKFFNNLIKKNNSQINLPSPTFDNAHDKLGCPKNVLAA